MGQRLVAMVDEMAAAKATEAEIRAAVAAEKAAREPQAVAATEPPGMAASAARGLGQGATLGFGDEASAGLYALMNMIRPASPEEDRKSFAQTYDEARDEERAGNLAAQEANPWTYGATEFIGGIPLAVAGAGPAMRGGATMAAKMGRGALAGGIEGAAGGIGHSTAEDTPSVLADALIGGGVGAAVGAGGGAISAPLARREAARETRQAFVRANPSKAFDVKIRFGGQEGRFTIGGKEYLKFADDEGFGKLVRADKFPEAFDVARAKRDDVGKQLTAVYDTADAAGEVVDVGEVTEALHGVMAGLKKTQGKARRMIGATVDDLIEDVPDGALAPTDLWQFAQDLDDSVFEGMSERQARQYGNKMSAAVRGVLERHVPDPTGLTVLNERYGKLAASLDLIEDQAEKVSRDSIPASKFFRRMSGGLTRSMAGAAARGGEGVMREGAPISGLGPFFDMMSEEEQP